MKVCPACGEQAVTLSVGDIKGSQIENYRIKGRIELRL